MLTQLLILLIALANLCNSENLSVQEKKVKETFTNPIHDGADPWLIKNGKYYYYCSSAKNSIHISRSEFLTKRGETKKIWSAPADGWNKACVWAPELHFIDDRWYVYYAAGESGPPYIYQKTGVLMSETSDPFSKYTDMGMLYTGDNPDLKSDNRWAIDMTVFKHRNRLYAVWSGWIDWADTDKTTQHLYIAEMETPFRLNGLRRKISGPEEDWETGGPLNLQEGPAILIKDGNLFIVYSCRESWTVNYRLGLLKLKDPDASLLAAENWEKTGPVFQGPYGAGHCSFNSSPDGKEDWIIYHSKKDSSDGWLRDVRLQKFGWKQGGNPEFGSPVPPGKEIRRPAGEAEIEKN